MWRTIKECICICIIVRKGVGHRGGKGREEIGGVYLPSQPERTKILFPCYGILSAIS
jgi:hypothetical protein